MPPRLRYPELAPEGIASMRALEHYLNASTALPAVLLELVRLRASLLNGCEFCIGHHTNELRKHNEPASRIAALQDWRTSDAFTAKERAALAWADAVTDIQDRNAADPEYAAVSAFFHDKDLVDLTLAIASINAWNRMSIALQSEWDPNRRKRRLNGPAQQPMEVTAAGTDADAAQTSEPALQAPSEAAPAHGDAPRQDTVGDDSGKVAHD